MSTLGHLWLVTSYSAVESNCFPGRMRGMGIGLSMIQISRKELSIGLSVNEQTFYYNKIGLFSRMSFFYSLITKPEMRNMMFKLWVDTIAQLYEASKLETIGK